MSFGLTSGHPQGTHGQNVSDPCYLCVPIVGFMNTFVCLTLCTAHTTLKSFSIILCNSIWHGIKIMKVLIVKFSPPSCYISQRLFLNTLNPYSSMNETASLAAQKTTCKSMMYILGCVFWINLVDQRF